jgi:predicted negative regulator of RcsB-dependent stress response
MLYQQLLESALDPQGQVNAARVVELASRLKSDYAGSHYAQYGSLFVAKVAVESGKLDDAAAELRGVLADPADSELDELARQRLARVLAAQDKVEEGLALLAGEVQPAFLSSREEIKGDLLVQVGRTGDARAAYEKARAALSDNAAAGELQIKLDDLANGGV